MYNQAQQILKRPFSYVKAYHTYHAQTSQGRQICSNPPRPLCCVQIKHLSKQKQTLPYATAKDSHSTSTSGLEQSESWPITEIQLKIAPNNRTCQKCPSGCSPCQHYYRQAMLYNMAIVIQPNQKTQSSAWMNVWQNGQMG